MITFPIGMSKQLRDRSSLVRTAMMCCITRMIKIKVGGPQATVELNARRALDGS